MEMEHANDHPLKVEVVKGEGVYANSHPYKVAIVGGGGGNEGRVVDTLPEQGEPGYIYLVLKKESKEGDIYDEYIWALQKDGETYGWEHIGATNEVTIKLYDTLGENTDGAMTQKAVKDTLFKNGYQSIVLSGQRPSQGAGRGTILLSTTGNDVPSPASSFVVNSDPNLTASMPNYQGVGYNIVLNGGVGDTYAMAMGYSSQALAKGSVALGAGAKATEQGQMDISVANNQDTYRPGYNGSEYRLLTGLYDPQNDHDATTKGYVDNLVSNISSEEDIFLPDGDDYYTISAEVQHYDYDESLTFNGVTSYPNGGPVATVDSFDGDKYLKFVLANDIRLDMAMLSYSSYNQRWAIDDMGEHNVSLTQEELLEKCGISVTIPDGVTGVYIYTNYNFQMKTNVVTTNVKLKMPFQAFACMDGDNDHTGILNKEGLQLPFKTIKLFRLHANKNWQDGDTGLIIIPNNFLAYGRNLETVELGNIQAETFIGELFCNYCNKLTTLSLPQKVVYMGRSLQDCPALTRVGHNGIQATSAYTSLGEGICRGAGIDSLPSLGKAVYLPNGFCASCQNLKSASFNSNLIEIGDTVLSSCPKLTSVNLTNTKVRTIGANFVSSSGVEKITLGSNVSINNGFAYNSKLTTLEVGYNVHFGDGNIFNSLGTNDPNSPMYTQGVTIIGPSRHAIMQELPNLNGENGYYRKLIDGGGADPESDSEDIVELTEKDYNYPTDNPTRIVLYDLPNGIYHLGHGIQYTFGASNDESVKIGDGLTILKTIAQQGISDVTGSAIFLTVGGGVGPNDTRFKRVSSRASKPDQEFNYLTSGSVINNLTSSTLNMPLSANQGRLLKEMIDNLSTGGIKTLTTDDYNYKFGDKTPYDGIAFWKLEPGMYYGQGDINYYQSNSGSVPMKDRVFIVTRSERYTLMVIPNGTSRLAVWKVETSTGRDELTGDKGTILLKDNIAYDLATTDGDKVLAATQGKVLNERLEIVEKRFVDVTTSGMPENPDPNTFYFTTED